ncbi:hypothetical protein [Lentzea waywayandensis]|nr:hypothetical protein [Lentzea waywayandensis]
MSLRDALERKRRGRGRLQLQAIHVQAASGGVRGKVVFLVSGI